MEWAVSDVVCLHEAQGRVGFLQTLLWRVLPILNILRSKDPSKVCCQHVLVIERLLLMYNIKHTQ